MQSQLILPRHHWPTISGKVAGGAMAVAVVAAGVGAYRYHQVSSTNSVSYSTATVKQGTITSTVSATGPISASSATKVTPRSPKPLHFLRGSDASSRLSLHTAFT